MSTSNPSTNDNQTDWQLLTEFLVPNLQQMQVEVVDHVADILRQFSLDPGQLDQILATISQSLDSLEDAFTPLRLRISVSDAVLAETWPETYAQDNSTEPDQGSQTAGGGLGFFLVKRFVGQLQEQNPKRYRLVEVLLYRE